MASTSDRTKNAPSAEPLTDRPATEAPGDAARTTVSSEPASPGDATVTPGNAPTRPPVAGSRRKWLLVGAAVLLVLLGAWWIVPWVITALNTVSTDDAYVNGHVTLVAPRVGGQVARVLVDDTQRVHRGDILVELDKEPFQVQVNIKQAAVVTSEADLNAAKAQTRGQVAAARSNRFRLEHAMEDVRNQIALLNSNVARLEAERADLELAEADYSRFSALVTKGAVSQQQFDQQKAALDVAKSRVRAADETVQQTRAGLGLAVNHEKPLDVPADLDQNFSTVRETLAVLVRSAAEIGYKPPSWDASPKEAVDEFYKQDPEGNLDRIYDHLIALAPAVKQAEARLLEARRDLDLAELNLRYCDVVSEIDGSVTRRNVNPGNTVQVGQALMAVRSIDEIWIDANFKETQLAGMRIGQRVDCRVDMYGHSELFKGRVAGFTMGTGQTLALLPPQNATGNFVKIVQRLPVRIELVDYDPEKRPLFAGLSVVPYVYLKEPPSGPNAGEVLRPPEQLPKGQPDATKPDATP